MGPKRSSLAAPRSQDIVFDFFWRRKQATYSSHQKRALRPHSGLSYSIEMPCGNLCSPND